MGCEALTGPDPKSQVRTVSAANKKCNPDGTIEIQNKEDEDRTCVCKLGFSGDTCWQRCPDNTYGNGRNVSECTNCACTNVTTTFVDTTCDHVTGQCSCKDVFTGILCDACPRMSIGTPPNCDFPGYVTECEQYNARSAESKKNYLLSSGTPTETK